MSTSIYGDVTTAVHWSDSKNSLYLWTDADRLTLRRTDTTALPCSMSAWR